MGLHPQPNTMAARPSRAGPEWQGLFIIGKCHSEPKAKNLKSLDTDSALV